jgi:repressor LexA
MAFIRNWSERHGYPPSVREIATGVGLASPSSVTYHLTTLQELGLLRRGAARSPRALDPIDEPAGICPEAVPPADAGARAGTVVTVPLLAHNARVLQLVDSGTVSDVLTLPRAMVGDAPLFAVTVTGDVPADLAIRHGDMAVVRRHPIAGDGELVAALIDGATTIRRCHRNDDRRLNLVDPSRDVDTVQDDTIVLGRVVCVLRSLVDRRRHPDREPARPGQGGSSC